MPHTFSISGNIVDVHSREIYPGTVTVTDNFISKITRSGQQYDSFIMPGFVDAHVHIESSMLVPSEFARLAVVHGTVGTVSDPHEIGNVLGKAGVRYMIENGKKVPFKFYFGAPSCVPATSFETAGDVITPADIRELFEDDGLIYLSEMMNFPGVIYDDPVVKEKLAIAKELGKAIDGHAPGLMGEKLEKYASAGITTDHECFTLEEALEKVKLGMKILIREGSAAKNYDALNSLITDYPEMVMLCSDDKHPNDLTEGHINQLAARSVTRGHDLFNVLRAACVNPVLHYGLNIGLLREGDPADFIVVNNLQEFKVDQTYIDGNITAVSGKSLLVHQEPEIVNRFETGYIKEEDISVHAPQGGAGSIKVIEALEGQLITNSHLLQPKIVNGYVISDTASDVLKLVVVNRYQNAVPSVAFIRNFGLKKGAIASCVGHDSHNIIAVGVADSDIVTAVNGLIDKKGGIAAAHENWCEVLPLPVAGIMSNEDGYKVAEKYEYVDKLAKELGTTLRAPFMTLSFMALLVIPSLKLSDKGLFDGNKFEFTNLFADKNSNG